MAKRVVSDLTGRLIEDDDRHIRIIVRQHPALTEPVELDADEGELKNLSIAGGNFVVIQLVTRDGPTEPVTLELDRFHAAFDADPIEILKRAPTARSTVQSSSSSKRDPSFLADMRAWCRQNGWPDLSDRGRVPRDAEEAYLKTRAA